MTSFPTTGPLAKLKGPGSSQSSESRVTYDYSGLEDHIKRQDAVEALRSSKFAALYGGDIPGALEAGNKIRNLVSGLQRAAPGTDERDPHQFKMPLVLARSVDSKTSSSSDGPEAAFGDPDDEEPLPGAPAPDGREKPTTAASGRKRFAGQV